MDLDVSSVINDVCDKVQHLADGLSDLTDLNKDLNKLHDLTDLNKDNLDKIVATLDTMRSKWDGRFHFVYYHKKCKETPIIKLFRKATLLQLVGNEEEIPLQDLVPQEFSDLASWRCYETVAKRLGHTGPKS